MAPLGQGGSGPKGDIERGNGLMRLGDPPGRRTPGLPEPGRRIEPRCVQLRQRVRKCRDPAQDRVHQPGEGRQAALPRQRDGGGDRRVSRGSEQQQAGGADPQHVPDRDGRRFPEQRLQHRVQRAQAPQHRGGQPMGGGAVAGIGWRQLVQRVLQGAAVVEHGGQQIEGGGAGEIGHERLRCSEQAARSGATGAR